MLPKPALDDAQLIAKLRAGEADAAVALHDRFRPVVERTLRRLLGRGDCDQEDLAQQAMIELVGTFGRFRGECSLDSWAATIAAHCAYKHIRRRKLERRLFESMPLYENPQGDAPMSVARQTQARSSLRRVVTHLQDMDNAKAWTYVLHDVCGYDLREVATITEASVSAAQTRLVRGRRELHERMATDPELAAMLAEVTGEP